jgi:sugar (pentulose or hexulose) kinase
VPAEGYLLSWDAGSGSCRCLVVDAAGRQISLTRSPTWTMPADGVAGSLEFDHRGMWDTFRQLTRRALEDVQPEKVLAVSVTSFRDGMVFLDAHGEVLYAGTNRDARAVGQGFEVAQQHGEEIYQRTGRWPLGTDGAAHLLWMRKYSPDVYRAVDKVSMVSDWLTYRLCGAYCSEPTSASSSLLFDVREKCWSEEIAGLLRLSPEIFPPLMSPGQVAGRLLQDVAMELGLPEGTPVVVGLADSQAACLACGAVKHGETVAIAGTTMPLQMTVNEPLMDNGHRSWTGAHALEGLWSLECSAGLAGIAYDWLWEAFGAEASSQHAYALLSEEAASERPGAAMACMGPWIADHGRLQFPSRVGFLAPFPMALQPPLTRPAMARAVLENIAFALQANLSQLEEISGRTVESLAVCGGLSRSALFNQVVADVCEMPVRVPALRESSALGAAMCGAVGAGIYDDLAQAAAGMEQGGSVVEADPSARSAYRTLYSRWRKLYQTLLGR